MAAKQAGKPLKFPGGLTQLQVRQAIVSYAVIKMGSFNQYLPYIIMM